MSIAAVGWWATSLAGAVLATSRWPSVVVDPDAACPGGWTRSDELRADYGIAVRSQSAEADHTWRALSAEPDLAVLSFGLPLGLGSGTPRALAERVLSGADLSSVVPPFGVAVRGRDGSVLVQQDWLGMCRIFTAVVDGLVVVGTRPSLVSSLAYGERAPDLEAWASYTASGHFAGERSPLAGVSLLRPGERWHLVPSAGGGWSLDVSLRAGSSETVLASRDLDPEAAIDTAADALQQVVVDLSSLRPGPVGLGLSGGKDSRLLAAAFLAAGARPSFSTNIDTAAEGTTAQVLIERAEAVLGVPLSHELYNAGSPDEVLLTGLHRRTRDLLGRYDFQFPSSYLDRPSEGATLSELPRPVSVTGAGGEMASGYWYGDADPAAPLAVDDLVARATTRLTAAVPRAVMDPVWLAQQQDRIADVVAGSRAIGLDGLEVLDHLYLVERVRRWYTSAYHVGMVTPFLAPELVAATFALPAEDKKARRLHDALIRRLMPAWSDVPFVSVSTGPSTATRVWDGDGLDVLCDLADSATGPLSALLDRDRVLTALEATTGGAARRSATTLRQFAVLAVADELLDPGSPRPASGAARQRVLAAQRAATPTPTVAPVRLRPTLRRALGRVRRRLFRR